MWKHRTFAIFALFLILVSCTKHSKQVSDPLSQFGELIKLDTSGVAVSNLLSPRAVVLKDSLLIISEPQSDPMIYVYNLKGDSLGSFLRLGRGPGETTNLLGLFSCGDHLVQATVDPNTVFIFDISDLIEAKVKPSTIFSLGSDNESFTPIAQYGNGKLFYVGNGPRTEPSYHTRFCILDTENDKKWLFGEYPSQDKNIATFPEKDYSKLTAYQGDPIVRPDNEKAVVFYYYALGFEIIDLEKKSLEKSVFFQYPKVNCRYIPEIKANIVKREMESFVGFLDAWCNNEYIYFLYSAKQFSSSNYKEAKYILKYDWEGEPICAYELSREITNFALDKDENTIYASVEEETGSKILMFKL